MITRLRTACLILALGSWSAPALAQSPAEDPTASAKALFEKASAALDRKDYDSACPMIEEALRLQPAANGARAALAECYEGAGKLATAWRTYVTVAEVAAAAGQSERREAARAHADSLKIRLGGVIFQIDPGTRALPALTITWDGAAIPADEWGKVLPADRGPHTLTAAAPGKAAWQRTITVADGATASSSVGPLDDLAPAAPAPAATAPPSAAGTAPPGAPPPQKSATALAPNPPVAARGTGSRSHQGQLGAIVRADVDALNAGVVTAVGATYAPSDHIEVGLAALLGKRAGFEAGATGYLLEGAVKPTVYIGAPVLFEGGAYTGVHGAAGVQWDPSRHFGVFANIGFSYFPAVPTGYVHMVLLPALGVQGRL